MFIPNLPEMDNAKYDCVEKYKRPTYSTYNQSTAQWLRVHDIEVDMKMTKAEMVQTFLIQCH